MKITAITRFVNAELRRVLRQLRWSTKRLALESGVSTNACYAFVNLKRVPKEESLKKLQAAFGRAGIVFDPTEAFPQFFSGMKNPPVVETTQDVSIKDLMSGEVKQLETSEEVDFCLSKLSERGRRVIKMSFLEGKTNEEIGKALGLSARTIPIKLNVEMRRIKKRFEFKEGRVLERGAV